MSNQITHLILNSEITSENTAIQGSGLKAGATMSRLVYRVFGVNGVCRVVKNLINLMNLINLINQKRRKEK